MAQNSKSFVNLDALIPRADLFEHPDATVADAPSLRITDLEPTNIESLPLMKPKLAHTTPRSGLALARGRRGVKPDERLPLRSPGAK